MTINFIIQERRGLTSPKVWVRELGKKHLVAYRNPSTPAGENHKKTDVS